MADHITSMSTAMLAGMPSPCCLNRMSNLSKELKQCLTAGSPTFSQPPAFVFFDAHLNFGFAEPELLFALLIAANDQMVRVPPFRRKHLPEIKIQYYLLVKMSEFPL